MMYMAQTYHDYIDKKDLNIYGSRKIAIPRPELYVIYTGEKKIEQKVISLSEEFFGGQQTDLDVKVHVLTDGKEGDIINQYVTFTKVLDDQIKQHGRTRQAITETIRLCKDRDVLKQYLSSHEQEVRKIMISLFDNDQIVRAYTKEKVEEGRAEGRAEGWQEKTIKTVKKMILKGYTDEQISEINELPLAEVAAIRVSMAH